MTMNTPAIREGMKFNMSSNFAGTKPMLISSSVLYPSIASRVFEILYAIGIKSR